MALENRSSLKVDAFLARRAQALDGDWTSLDPMADLVAGADDFISSLVIDQHGIALVAIGGYGRRELGPHSDLDVLLLHKPRLEIKNLTESLWYPIWDTGISLDYSVRTVAQAVRVAESDPRALIGMLDARLICGDEILFKSLKGKITSRFVGRLDRYRVILRSQAETRRAESGELAFLLEPDIKESHGGLRDLVNLRHLAANEADFVGDFAAIEESSRLLLVVRNLLQHRSMRAQNRLYLQDQDWVAEMMGFDDADELMLRIAGTGRFVSRALEENCRVRQGRRGSRRIADQWGTIPAGLFSHGDEICVDPSVISGLDAQVVIKIAAASVNLGLNLCVDALELLATRLEPYEGIWSPSTFSALCSLMSHGDEAIAVLERLDHYGLIDKVMPEWQRVRYRPQRNAYHTFTVDRHLIEAGVAAGRLRRNVRRPDLLIAAALLHDIGKGSPGDHSMMGADIARGVAIRMGLIPDDVEIVVRLVRHHLLLADTATRRDVSDPKTISDVAHALVDPLTVELLKVLTEADSRATGPAAWSKWKEELIDELCEATLAFMRGDPDSSRGSFPGVFERELMSGFTGELVLHSSGEDLWVVAQDEVGLFAKVTGTLAVMGLSVLSADVYSECSVAVEHFRVVAAHGREVNWARFKAELYRGFADPDSIRSRLVERTISTKRRRKVAESAKIEPRVTIHREASERAMVFEVCGPDSVGLLHGLTDALARNGLNIVHAKVLTLGDDVVDTFYVVDSSGRPIVEEELISRAKGDLESIVTSVGEPRA